VTFLRSPWKSLAARDFFTVNAWTPKGLKRFLVLFGPSEKALGPRW
jgi:hypothetical protein